MKSRKKRLLEAIENIPNDERIFYDCLTMERKDVYGNSWSDESRLMHLNNMINKYCLLHSQHFGIHIVTPQIEYLNEADVYLAMQQIQAQLIREYDISSQVSKEIQAARIAAWSSACTTIGLIITNILLAIFQ